MMCSSCWGARMLAAGFAAAVAGGALLFSIQPTRTAATSDGAAAVTPAKAQAPAPAQAQPPAATPGATPGADRPAAPPAGRAAAPAGKKPGQEIQHTAAGDPPLDVTPETLDMGKLRPGQKVTKSWTLLNISDKPLHILATKASCTCTSVNLQDKMLGPGESVELKAEYRSGGGTGPKQAAVRVKVDGYDLIELPIKAEIVQPIMADPSYINAMPADAESPPPTSGEYVVSSEDGQPFRILSVDQGPAPFVDFDPAKDQPRSSYRLSWDFSKYDQTTGKDQSGKKMPAFMIVETDRPDCPVIDLEVRHMSLKRAMFQATDQWILNDKRVSIGPVEEGKPAEFEIMVKWLPKRQHTDPITQAMSDSKQFTVELVKVEQDGDSQVCHVKVTPVPGQKGLILGSMRLFSNKQSASLLVIGHAQ